MISPALPPHLPASMLGEDEARARILAQITPLAAVALPLAASRNFFASRDEFATHPLPAFDNSAMDGYALPVDDAVGTHNAGSRFRVCGEQPAGPDRGLRAAPGVAVRIFTGAPIPAGTGAVVMQEDVERADDQITLREPVGHGENIRRAGGDLARGQRLFAAGAKLTAARLALLASQGRADVSVSRAPRVAVLATGDELRPAGQPLGPGEIYESNGTLLAALAASCGGTVTVLERARDERPDLDAKLALGLVAHDVLVIAGGVSVGERDLVKERLTAAGVRLDFWRVLVQPGKPFLYGCRPAGSVEGDTDTHVFGLPGNPVSAFVTFLLFVRPALLRLMGSAEAELPLPSSPAVAAVELVNRGHRPHYLRGVVDAQDHFTPTGRQESHALFALSGCRALIRVEPGTVVPAGAPVRAFRWDG